ncbi:MULTISPECIES: tyrosine-type recombinase/integrase [unclassified Streptomyces]|uniref:tyrosine-type recombinase/integrase n=1 Tax=unclassified Streptomyces TaxID=2593676 RepID=UPI0037FDFB1D
MQTFHVREDDRDGKGAIEKLEAVVQLHRTRRTKVGVAAGLPSTAALAVLDRAGASDSKFFVLGPDGSYDVQLNRLGRELDSWGVRSDNGHEGYMRDLMLYSRFLHESRGGKSIWETDNDDLRAYKAVRMRPDREDSIAASTWRRSIAALDKWVEWGLYEGLLTKEPFRYVDKTVMTPQGPRRVRVNAEQEVDDDAEPLRVVQFVDYLLWRNVGLRGELPDGRPDPRWRGRHGERNSLFSDSLVYTGMRLGEGASLLVTELPPVAGSARIRGDVHLSAAVTKRHKARTVYSNLRTLRSWHHYVAIERDALVERARARGRYATVKDYVPVQRASRHALVVAHRSRALPYSKIGVEARRALYRVNAAGDVREPLALWLGDDGQPLQSSTWQSVFRRANERCASFDIDVEVSPHTLRHVFAVQMLGLMLRQTIRALGQREDRHFTRAELERLLFGNPMRKLQQLLGHAHESTVHIYLDLLDEFQEIVLSALAEWDVQVAMLEAAAEAGAA